MEPGVIFGEVLRSYRKHHGYSQERLAHEAGLERVFISMLERGERQPTITTQIKLARALGCTAAEMVAEVEARMAASGMGAD